jgi:hypothetical protein
MKRTQQRSRAEPESPTPSYARRRRAANASNQITFLASHPECKTVRLYINGAPSCLRSPPFPSAIRDRLPASRDLTPGHNRKKATTAMATMSVAQAGRDHEVLPSAAYNLPQTMSPQRDTLQKDEQSSQQYPCHCSPQYRAHQAMAATTEESTSIRSHHCLQPYPCG